MEIDAALNSKISPNEVTVTRNIEPGRADVLKCYKSGYVCTLTFNNVAYSNSYSTDTLIATLDGTRPQSTTRFTLIDDHKNQLICFINTYGNVYINGYEANRLLYGTVTFIVQ